MKKITHGTRIADIDKALTEIDTQIKAVGSAMTADQKKMVGTAQSALRTAKSRLSIWLGTPPEWRDKKYSSTVKTIANKMPMTDARTFVQSIAQAIGE